MATLPLVVKRFCECEHHDSTHLDKGDGPCRGKRSLRDKFGTMTSACTCEQFRLRAVVFEGVIGKHTFDCPCWRCRDGLIKFPTPEAALMAEAIVRQQYQLEQRDIARGELALAPRRWIGDMR